MQYTDSRSGVPMSGHIMIPVTLLDTFPVWGWVCRTCVVAVAPGDGLFAVGTAEFLLLRGSTASHMYGICFMYGWGLSYMIYIAGFLPAL